MTFELIEVFNHKRRKCVIVKVNIPKIGESHNGYVSLSENFNREKDPADFIEDIEITWYGKLSQYELPEEYIGFDTNHVYNDIHPETKTYENVRKVTINLAEEMIRKGV